MKLAEIIKANKLPFNFSAVSIDESELPVTMVTIELPQCVVKSVDDEWEVFGLNFSSEQPPTIENYPSFLDEALNQLNAKAQEDEVISVEYNGVSYEVA